MTIRMQNLFEKESHERGHQPAMPFMLVGNNGEPFSVIAVSKGRFFESEYFLVSSIEEKSRCVVLEVLASYSDYTDMLFRTEGRIIVDLSCFFGMELLSIPVYDCLLVSRKMHDHFCRAFTLTEEDCPKVLWSTVQKKVKNKGTVMVNYTGTDCQVELTLNTEDGELKMTVLKGECQTIPVLNLKTIVVSQPIEQVKGLVEVKLIFDEEKEICY